MEIIAERHKTEQKELLAKIQGLKHAIPKGDKKRKKQVNIDIANLQAKLDEKHAEEIKEFQSLSNGVESINLTEETSTIENGSLQRVSKAAKRREKKEAENRARQKRFEDGEEESKNHVRNVEANLFNQLLQKNQLELIEVNPDGNCLYNAVLTQLLDKDFKQLQDASSLREAVCNYMLLNVDDFIAFTSNNSTGDMLTTDEYESYCKKIKETNCWGGQLELKAISKILESHIEVYQVTSPLISIGEEYKESMTIRLSYHRHQYGLGEHYNALLKNSHEQ